MGILKNTRDMDDRKDLREMFNAIDTDNNGFIENEELRVAMRLLTTPSDEMKLTKEEIDEMIAEIDGDKDGRLTFEGNERNYFNKMRFFFFRICKHLYRTNINELFSVLKI